MGKDKGTQEQVEDGRVCGVAWHGVRPISWGCMPALRLGDGPPSQRPPTSVAEDGRGRRDASKNQRIAPHPCLPQPPHLTPTHSSPTPTLKKTR